MADGPPVETYAIMPVAKFRALEQRLKKAESEVTPQASQVPTKDESMEEPTNDSHSPPSPQPEEKKKDIKGKYRQVQIKKLLQHIERLEGSQEIMSLDNIDQLIQSALGSNKKIIPNESKFFSYLFNNNLAHFVRNRWKIGLYYKNRDNWFQI